MNISILDDYFDTLRGLPCFRETCTSHFCDIFDQNVSYTAGHPIHAVNPDVLA